MKSFVAVIVVLSVVAVAFGLKGSGVTTRYWDCCKPSCAWKENVGKLTPVKSCAKDGRSILSPSVHSGCDWDGTSYVCNKLQPWAVNDKLAYGFVAASFTGGIDNSKCCICLKLTFKNAPLAGKTFIVQNVNTGGDLGSNHFDIQMPGSGVGIFTRGCQTQWNAPATGWGDQYGGVRTEGDCKNLPQALQAGCRFRFEWFKNANNPQVDFEQIKCPKALTSRTGCANNHLY